MINSTLYNYCTQLTAGCLLLLLTCIASPGVQAQYRNERLSFSENIKGDIAIFGNTLMNLVKPDGTVDMTAMNGNSTDGNSIYDNGAFGLANMQYTDIDGNSGFGAGTRNSSSAALMLPAGVNTIKLARLYWGGRVLSSDFNITLPSNQTIKIRKGTTGDYREYAATQFDKTVRNTGTDSSFYFYQAFADITDMVRQKGAGIYTVGNGVFSAGPGGDFGNYGGWSIVVVYENPALSFNSVRLYDGFQQVYNGGGVITSDITLTGLNVPSGALSAGDAHMGIITWEGDAKYDGDKLSINNNFFSNALNPLNNIMNGTITKNGVNVTNKNPDYTDQMGIDIDQFDVGAGYGILPNASSVALQFVTSQDQFFFGVISFVIKMKNPLIKITKTVADANFNNLAEPLEVLTYTIKGTNTGAANANAAMLTDVLPSAISFVPNSLKVNYCPGITYGFKTDAAGDDIADYNAATKTVSFKLGNNATSTNGGTLEPGSSFEIEFKAVASTAPKDGTNNIINIARLQAVSDAMEPFVDDATAIINFKNPLLINYKNVFIPNTFSPNNDGLNDNWKVPALAAYPLAEIKVYNRYGQIVFYNKGYTTQWDGTFNGFKQPSGAYTYIIDTKNGLPIYSGMVIIIR